jgi:hypothetical protein
MSRDKVGKLIDMKAEIVLFKKKDGFISKINSKYILITNKMVQLQ